MDHRSEARDFLTTRRARLSPEQAGLPLYGGGARRVAGLRREEVADAGLRLNAYSAEPGSPSQDALNLLASWTVTTAGQGQPRASR